MSTITPQALTELRAAGPTVVTAEDPDFEAARRVWNAGIDRRPDLIARCRSTTDVQAAVRAATAGDWEISVRGGAHSFPGYSVGDGGMQIDLSGMRNVVVDADRRRARVQGGALLGDVDEATQQFGLAAPLGMVSHTGVGGLTLGGGMGWLSRQAGLSIDNLLSAEIVTADGATLRVDEQSHADLFWALRGGGGNFGVVTEFEFALHPVGPLVHFGLFFWDQSRGAEALALMQEVVADLPLTLNAVPVAGLTAPPLPVVPTEYHFANGYAMELVGFGEEAEHQAVVDAVRRAVPPLFDVVMDLPYVQVQQLIDQAYGWGSFGYDKGLYLADLTDEVIDVLVRSAPGKTSPQSALTFYRLDGAYSAVADDATAFSGPRVPCYFLNLIGLCPDPAMLPAEREWVRAVAADLGHYAVDASCYVNMLQVKSVADVRSAYGSKFERLQAIKSIYDRDNVFHRNVNIPPRMERTTEPLVQQ